MGPRIKITAVGTSKSASDLAFLNGVRRQFDEAADKSAREYGNLVMQSAALEKNLNSLKSEQLHRVLIEILGFPETIKKDLKMRGGKVPRRADLIEFVIQNKMFMDVMSVLAFRSELNKAFKENEMEYIVEGIMWGAYGVEYPEKGLDSLRGIDSYHDYIGSLMFNKDGKLKYSPPELSAEGLMNAGHAGTRMVLKGGGKKHICLMRHLALKGIYDLDDKPLMDSILRPEKDSYTKEMEYFILNDIKTFYKRKSRAEIAKFIVDFKNEHISKNDDSEVDEEGPFENVSSSLSSERKSASPPAKSSPGEASSSALGEKKAQKQLVEDTSKEELHSEKEEQGEDEEEADAMDVDRTQVQAPVDEPDEDRYADQYTPDAEAIYNVLHFLLDFGNFSSFDHLIGKKRVQILTTDAKSDTRMLPVKRVLGEIEANLSKAKKMKKAKDMPARIATLILALKGEYGVRALTPNPDRPAINVADYRAVKREIWLVIRKLFEQVIYCSLCEHLRLSTPLKDLNLRSRSVESLSSAAMKVESKVEQVLEVLSSSFDDSILEMEVDTLTEAIYSRLDGICTKDDKGNVDGLDQSNTETFLEDFDSEALSVAVDKLVNAFQVQLDSTTLKASPAYAQAIIASKNGSAVLEAAAWAGVADISGFKTDQHGKAASARKLAKDKDNARRASLSASSQRSPKRALFQEISSKSTSKAVSSPHKRVRKGDSVAPHSGSTAPQSPIANDVDDGDDQAMDAQQDDDDDNNDDDDDDDGDGDDGGEPSGNRSVMKKAKPKPKVKITVRKLPAKAKPQQRLKFSEEEDESILAGLAKYGFADWKAIINDYDSCTVLEHRTPENIKDRVRTLRRLGLYDFRRFDRSQERFQNDPKYRVKLLLNKKALVTQSIAKKKRAGMMGGEGRVSERAEEEDAA